MTESPNATAAPPGVAARSARARELADRAIAELGRVVVGMEEVGRQLLVALIAGGHVLLEGVPGVAKTTMSKTFARLLGFQYQRVQFTPDLLPSDVTGTFIFDRKVNDFVLRKGPLFCQVLLADEINRAPAKTQSALLEAMQENQATIEGTTLPLPRPFLVLATQNPVEQEGVYRLPEAQLDRFLLRVEMGYPGHDPEVEMLRVHSRPVVEVPAVFDPDEVLELQSRLGEVHATDALLHYVVAVAEATRKHPDVALGASPRAALGMLRCARARAFLAGRHYVTHEDVQSVAPAVLTHRLIVRPEAAVEGREPAAVVAEVLAALPVLETR
jgi:MoxR-like ATPase